MDLKRRPETAMSGPLETIRAVKLNGPDLSNKSCGQACEHCSAVFATSTHGRTKRFCSDRCRQAHRKVASTPENGLRYRTGRVAPKSALQAADLQGEFKPEIPSRKTNLCFERVNEVTWKLTNGEQINVPASHGKWCGYRTTKAIYCLGHQCWTRCMARPMRGSILRAVFICRGEGQRKRDG
jgi:hypothetical protein